MAIHTLLKSLFILAGLLLTAKAQNLVVNGGFEAGPSGWTGSLGYDTNVTFALDGRGVAVVMDLSSSSVNQTMTQILSTEPQMPYLLRFSLYSGFGRVGENTPGNSPVKVTWGNEVVAQVFSPVNAWHSFQYNLTALSSQTILNFESLGAHYQFIDGISVTAIPEPHTTCLLISSAAALGLSVLMEKLRRLKAKVFVEAKVTPGATHKSLGSGYTVLEP